MNETTTIRCWYTPKAQKMIDFEWTFQLSPDQLYAEHDDIRQSESSFDLGIYNKVFSSTATWILKLICNNGLTCQSTPQTCTSRIQKWLRKQHKTKCQTSENPYVSADLQNPLSNRSQGQNGIMLSFPVRLYLFKWLQYRKMILVVKIGIWNILGASCISHASNATKSEKNSHHILKTWEGGKRQDEMRKHMKGTAITTRYIVNYIVQLRGKVGTSYIPFDDTDVLAKKKSLHCQKSTKALHNVLLTTWWTYSGIHLEPGTLPQAKSGCGKAINSIVKHSTIAKKRTWFYTLELIRPSMESLAFVDFQKLWGRSGVSRTTAKLEVMPC